MVASSVRDRSWSMLQSKFVEYRESGDPDAAHYVFAELDSILKAYFHAKTRRSEDALDLSQATMLKIHLHRLAFRSELPLRSWVFTIASRQLTDYWRSAGRGKSRINSEVQVDSLGESSMGLRGFEDREHCEKLLAHLSQEERELLKAYAVEDLAVREIAEDFGFKESAMKVKLHRIYKNLRNIASPLILLLEIGVLERLLLQPNVGLERIGTVAHLPKEVL